MTRALSFLLAWSLVLAASARAEDEPTDPRPSEPTPRAIAHRVEGKVTLRRGEDAPRDLVANEILYAGDVLMPDAYCSARLILHDCIHKLVRARYDVAAPSADAAAPCSAFQYLFTKLERMKNTRGPSATSTGTRGTGVALPIEPRGRVLTGTPRFVWESGGEDRRHRLLIYREVEKSNLELVYSTVVEGPSTALSLEKPALPPGLYAWRVDTIRDLEGVTDERVTTIPSETAYFFVYTPEEAEKIRLELAAYDASLPSEDPLLRHKLLAAFYVKDGKYLLDLARHELERALELEPGDPSALDLLDYVRHLLGLPRKQRE